MYVEDAFVAPHPHLHEALPDGWEDSYGEYVYPEINKRAEEILENSGSGVDFVDSWPDDEDEGFEDGSISDLPESSMAIMQDERSSTLLDIVLHNKEHDVIVQKLENHFGKPMSNTSSSG